MLLQYIDQVMSMLDSSEALALFAVFLAEEVGFVFGSDLLEQVFTADSSLFEVLAAFFAAEGLPVMGFWSPLSEGPSLFAILRFLAKKGWTSASLMIPVSTWSAAGIICIFVNTNWYVREPFSSPGRVCIPLSLGWVGGGIAQLRSKLECKLKCDIVNFIQFHVTLNH